MINDNKIASYIKENKIKTYDIRANNLNDIALKNENDFLELLETHHIHTIYQRFVEEVSHSTPDFDIDLEELQKLAEGKYKYLEAISDIMTADEYLDKLYAIFQKHMKQFNAQEKTRIERWLNYSFIFSEACCYSYTYYEAEGEEFEHLYQYDVTLKIIDDSAEDFKNWGLEIANKINLEYTEIKNHLATDSAFLSCKTKEQRALYYDDLIDEKYPYLSLLKNQGNLLKKLPNTYPSFDKRHRSLFAERIYDEHLE